jgi:hypothetical protein
MKFGGHLVTTRAGLMKTYYSKVRDRHEERKLALVRRLCESGADVALEFDGSNLQCSNQRPCNIIMQTVRFSMYLQTVMLDDVKEDADEKLKPEQEYLRVLRLIQDKWFPGEHRRCVRKVKGDNHPSVENSVRLARDAGIFPRARWINCLFHGMNRCGVHIYEHPLFVIANGWVAKVKTMLKSGDKIQRRSDLQAFLRAKNAPSDLCQLRFDFSDTRVSAYADAVKWNFYAFPFLLEFCNENSLAPCECFP